MKKERKICKIVIQDKQFTYPIYAELIKYEPKKDKTDFNKAIYKELLTGMGLYVGYTHPLIRGYNSLGYYYYPYTHPDEIVSKIKDYCGPINGLYFDQYVLDQIDVTETSAEEAKNYYKNLYPNKNFKNSLEGYIEMLDNAIVRQNKESEKELEGYIKSNRLEYLYSSIHKEEQTQPEEFVEKLLNR